MSRKMRHYSGFNVLPHEPEEEAGWRPRVDVYRCPDGWLLKFELAGVLPEDVRVEVQGCQVRISGHRRDTRLEEGWTHYSMEIAYNRFERTVQLPCDLQNPRHEVSSLHGILIVRVLTEDR